MTAVDPISEVARTAAPPTGLEQRDLLVLGVLYALVFGHLLLIPNAVFWDDWVLYGASRETIARMFELSSAFPAIPWLHFLLLGLGMWSYKALTFALWFASGLLLNRILLRSSVFTDAARFGVVLLFLVLPFNSARVAGITFPYTLCAFLFMLAWDQMDRRRVLSLVGFALSFVTASHLVFYALPILDAAYRGGHLASPRAALRFALRRLDFLILPFAYYAWYLATFKPLEPYAGYNSYYSLNYLIPGLRVQRLDALGVLADVNALLVALLLPLAWWLLSRSGSLRQREPDAKTRRKLVWLGLGLLAFVLGGLPYWIINKVPTFVEWDSRHQLLLPLGTAVFLVALIWVLPARIRLAALALVTATCLSMGLSTGYAFWVDARKQQVLIDLMASNLDIRRASVVVFVDRTSSLNAIGRSYRMYEWNGLMAQAFGDETRVGGDPRDVRTYFEGGLDNVLHLHYRATQHRRSPEPVLVLAEIQTAPSVRRGSSVLGWSALPELRLTATPITQDALRTLAGD